MFHAAGAASGSGKGFPAVARALNRSKSDLKLWFSILLGEGLGVVLRRLDRWTHILIVLVTDVISSERAGGCYSGLPL